MESRILTEEKLKEFAKYLKEAEYAAATIGKYLREIRIFQDWLGDREVSREAAAQFKAWLQGEGFAPVTVNARLSALNAFFSVCGLGGVSGEVFAHPAPAFPESVQGADPGGIRTAS